MRVFGVPIEPLEERYSVDWRTYFASRTDVEIEGQPLTDKIEQGRFLDVHSTNHFKSSQVQTLVRLLHEGQIKNGDWVFFHDLWFPGLETLAYIRSAVGPKFFIAGCLHAGTWDPWDFLSQREMHRWARGFERSIFDIANLVFVATSYHRDLLAKTFGDDVVRRKVRVTGFPIYPKGPMVSLCEKEEGLVVFPHRLDPEKQPALFDSLAEVGKNEGLRFVKTKEVCVNKEQYYELLKRADFAVSFAQQETWGIAMQEALFAGAIPVVPDALSYREMYPDRFRYRRVPLYEPKFVLGAIRAMRADRMVTRRVCEATIEVLARKGREAIPLMMSLMMNYGN